MKYLCEVETTGGPVAIMPREHAWLWGDADNTRFVEHFTGSSCIQVLPGFKDACTTCLFHHESDEGNVRVYYERETIVLLRRAALFPFAKLPVTIRSVPPSPLLPSC